MKKLSVLFMSIVALATTVTSCDDKKENSTPTALDVKVKDALNVPVSAARVILYSDSSFKTAVDTVITDVAGIAKFSEKLVSQKYYFNVLGSKTQGCMSN